MLSKLTRYRAFFMARSDDGYGTWYRASFPDDLEPRLVFMVHSDERRRKVQRAVTEKLGILAPSQFKVLVMTFAEAPVLLARYIREGVAEPAAPQRTRVVTFDEPMLERVRSGFNALAESLNALRKIITDHNKAGGPQLQLPPVPIDAIKALRGFVKQVVDAGLGPDAVPAPVSPRPTGTGR